jgi:putative lipoprotein (rSAM/lipoprotein system)
MRKHLFKLASAILAPIVGGCGGVTADYGSPHATYNLDGNVKSAATSLPVVNIVIDFDGNTTTSETDGTWQLLGAEAFTCMDICEITASDEDGASNGSFNESTITFQATQTAEGTDEWDNGAFEASNVNFLLKPAR